MVITMPSKAAWGNESRAGIPKINSQMPSHFVFTFLFLKKFLAHLYKMCVFTGVYTHIHVHLLETFCRLY